MATAPSITYVSVDEYLRTAYSPDVDFVDDHIEERNLGEYDHATLQMVIASAFFQKRQEWKIRVVPEQRVQTSERRFRVPDICLMSRQNPKEQIIRLAPILCVEVLSPEDTWKRIQVRVQDFFAMGVPEVWIFDPAARIAHICTPKSKSEHTSGVITLSGTLIQLDLDEVFRALDED